MTAPFAAARRRDVAAGSSAFLRDVVAGLTARPKHLSPKYFYDEAGARLFEAITALAEYYPTRCETGILRERGAEIARFFPARSALIEFGSGSSRKVRLLLAAAPAIAAYVPVDISCEMLVQEAEELAAISVRDAARLTAAVSRRVRERGGAQPGDKTFVDGLLSVREALVGVDDAAIAARVAASAAERAVVETSALTSTKGRAAWVGERGAGERDPGSVALLRFLEELRDVLS